MEKTVATLEKGTVCSAWNYSAQRLATGSINGLLTIFDSPDPASSSPFSPSSSFQVHEGSIVKVAWVPPEYGDAIACILDDGTLSLWEEVTGELALPENTGDPVHAVAWAPNICRPYEIISVATQMGIAIWHIGLHPDVNGHLSVEKIALLSGHQGEVWQMEWDMSGMTLASTGSDGVVRLWQSNLNGVWHEQAVLEPTS
ncbi:hypothetical protein SOVF_066800 [Spinacia oleracea]|nr:hypothetical protein SOVF_066800 [Spinacia oleracea]